MARCLLTYYTMCAELIIVLANNLELSLYDVCLKDTKKELQMLGNPCQPPDGDRLTDLKPLDVSVQSNGQVGREVFF